VAMLSWYDNKISLKRKEIIKLQQQCPNFKNIYNFLKEGTLPDDQKRAYAIPY
jgi:hypothetical protein